MALSFPRPIVHFDLDVGGFDRAIWRVSPEEISSKPYLIPIQMEKLLGSKRETTIHFPKRVVGYREVWEQIVVDFVAACQDPKVETIIMDSATQLWTIAHTSLLQLKQEIQLAANPNLADIDLREKLKPVEFPNDRMRSIIYNARGSHKNLVLTHYPRNVYKQKVTEKGVEDYKSDELEPDGFKDTQKLVDIVIWIEFNEKTTQVHARITKCGLEGLGTAAVGLEIEPSYQGIINLQKSMRGEE